VAERLGRRWLAFELNEDYLQGSQLRFLDPGTVQEETPQGPEIQPVQGQLALG
jgi:hypothetical protein